jgi:hypothetical protein
MSPDQALGRAGEDEPLSAEPWFSTTGRLHLHEVGLAAAATSWTTYDAMHLGPTREE